MKDSEIIENILAVFEAIASTLPKKKENVASVLIKTSMGKPIKVEYG